MSADTKPIDAVPETAPAVEQSKPVEAPVDVSAAAPPAVTETTPETKAESEPVKTEEAPKEDAVAAAPAATTATDVKEDVKEEAKGEVKPETPTALFFKALPEIFSKAGYQEMWGIELSTDPTDVKTSVVLYKFLKANNGDLSKAQTQLTEALEWRKKVQPQKLLEEVKFDPKFSNLGFVTVYDKSTGTGKEVITWNIYGAVKDMKKTFGDVDEFIKWRAALMELSVQQLNLNSITEPIPEGGPDPYQMIQVHDYLNVKFFRADPAVRAASKETIRVFSIAYPELLYEKFFVNVPLVMGWAFTAMKVFVSPETVRKFHPLSYGSSLAGELKGFGEKIPKAYGGKGPDVTEGLTVKYASPPVAETKPAAVATEAKADEVKTAESEPAEVVPTESAEVKPTETVPSTA